MGTQVCWDTKCLSHKRYGPIRVLLASGNWWSASLFGWSFSVAWQVRSLKGQSLWSLSLLLVFLCCSADIAGVWGEREQWWWLHTLRVTREYHLASGEPGFLPQAFPTVIPSLTSPRAASLPSKAWDCPPVPMLQLPAVVLSRGLESLSGVRMAAERIVCVIFIPFRLSRISCFTLSLKCFSSVPKNCLDVEIRPLLQFPHPPRQGPIPHTLLFSPLLLSSYWILHGSMYSFPVVRYSCLLSVGLQDLLCLKVNSWGIHGERCTPHPPTPLPSWELTS